MPRLRSGWGLRRKAFAGVLFLASGLLGLLVLESGRMLAHNWYPLGAPPVPEAVMMFPLFCGLFGLPTLILGALESPATPPQEEDSAPLPARRKIRGILAGAVAGGLLGWYPGMTGGHGSVMARLLAGDDDGPVTSAGERSPAGAGGPLPDESDDRPTREFLVSASSVTVANAFFNIVALFVILRARSGALHIARQVLGAGLVRWVPAAAVPPEFALLAVSAALAALIALPLTMFLGKRFARLYARVPYRRLMVSVVASLVSLLFFFSGVAGLAVTGVSVCLGLLPPLLGVRRVHLMGAILLPVILYFTGALPGVMAFLGF